MTETNPPPTSSAVAPPDHMFPTLTAAQIARIRAHGRTRPIQSGEVLVEAGQHAIRFFLVSAGQLEIAGRSSADQIMAVLREGQFTGEVNMLSGRPGLVRIRVSESGEVIEVDREQLLGLVQTDSELSE